MSPIDEPTEPMGDEPMGDEPVTAGEAEQQVAAIDEAKPRGRWTPREVLKRISDKPAMSTAQRERGEMKWGVAAAVFLVVLGLIAAGIYVFTPGQSRLTAYFDEAGQIKVGDSVRVAGVPVGSVKKVSLERDRVAVEMSIRRGVFIGEDSRADAKMLTAVGGNFLDITSIGSKPMDSDAAMSKENTSVPYSLTKTFSLVQPKLEQIDVTPLRKVLTELQQGLDANPGALKRNISTLQSMLVNLNTRQDEFGKLLNLASQYTKQMDLDGNILTALTDNLAAFVSEFEVYGARLAYAIAKLADLLERVKGVVLEYDTAIDPLMRRLDKIGHQFGPLLQRYEPTIRAGRDLIKRLEGMVAPDGSIMIDHSPIVLSSNYCLPMPGVKC